METHTLTDAEEKELREVILTALKNRLAALELKPGSKRALDVECSYMSGVMVTINTLFPAENPEHISGVIPVAWVLAPLRGASVLEKI